MFRIMLQSIDNVSVNVLGKVGGKEKETFQVILHTSSSLFKQLLRQCCIVLEMILAMFQLNIRQYLEQCFM